MHPAQSSSYRTKTKNPDFRFCDALSVDTAQDCRPKDYIRCHDCPTSKSEECRYRRTSRRLKLLKTIKGLRTLTAGGVDTMHLHCSQFDTHKKIGQGAVTDQPRLPAKCAPLLIGLLLMASLLIWPLRSWGAEQNPRVDTVLCATLSNGLRVVIVRNSLAPVVTTVMNYKTSPK